MPIHQHLALHHKLNFVTFFKIHSSYNDPCLKIYISLILVVHFSQHKEIIIWETLHFPFSTKFPKHQYELSMTRPRNVVICIRAESISITCTFVLIKTPNLLPYGFHFTDICKHQCIPSSLCEGHVLIWIAYILQEFRTLLCNGKIVPTQELTHLTGSRHLWLNVTHVTLQSTFST